MNRKAKKSKSRAGASKLKSRRTAKGKSSSKKAVVSRRKAARRTPKKTAIAKAKTRGATAMAPNRIVRIMGQGQFTVDNRTLKRLNDLDNAIVELVSTERSDDIEFKKKLTELNRIVVKDGRPLDPHEIIKSDIILPSADLSIDEAKKLFRGEGVIPEI
jgi:hypothetical protein